MKKAVIVAAKRTPVGSFLGSLSKVSAPQLGSTVIRALLDESGVPAEAVDEIIMGNVLTAALGQNPARQAAIGAGIPVEVPATTVNVVCGSGLYALQLAAQAIACGDADIVIAGGQESMSQAPHTLSGMRNGQKFGNQTLVDSMVADGLTDSYQHYHMGITAENVAEKLSISREEQDAFALRSQQRASAADRADKFVDEISPVIIPQRKGEPITVNRDEYIRHDADAASIAKLPPAFKDGSVTAANASGINDGAAAVLMMSEEKARELSLTPLASVKSYAAAGIAPEIMGLGPVPASQKALSKAGWQVADLDIIEANEAFASQAIGVCRELGLPEDKTNVNGGAIALGHPIGASGCRIVVSLLHEMQRSQAKKGLATLCVGGGMGFAMTFEHEAD